MKTFFRIASRYKYFFIEEHRRSESPKPIYDIITQKDKALLGTIQWHGQWHEWEFCPFEETGWTIQCLKDLVSFVDELNHA